MRLGLKTFLAALLAAGLVLPGAAAKPGNGNGNGGGQGGSKPSWAGPPSERGSGDGGGKPDFAAQGQAKKAEKAAAKAEGGHYPAGDKDEFGHARPCSSW